MNTASGGYQTFSVSFNSTTNKLTIAIILQFGTYTTNSARKILGFNQTDTSSSSTQVSDNVMDLSFPISLGINIRENSSDSFWCTGGFQIKFILHSICFFIWVISIINTSRTATNP